MAGHSPTGANPWSVKQRSRKILKPPHVTFHWINLIKRALVSYAVDLPNEKCISQERFKNLHLSLRGQRSSARSNLPSNKGIASSHTCPGGGCQGQTLLAMTT